MGRNSVRPVSMQCNVPAVQLTPLLPCLAAAGADGGDGGCRAVRRQEVTTPPCLTALQCVCHLGAAPPEQPQPLQRVGWGFF